MSLLRIKVENFRCIRKVALDLDPLTILYGANGTGKSSIIEGLQLLKQSLNTPVNLRGEMDFGEYYDIVRNNDEKLWITFEVEVKPTQLELKELTKLKEKVPFDIPEILSIGFRVRFRREEIEQSILVNSEEFQTVATLRIDPSTFQRQIIYPSMLTAENLRASPQVLLRPSSFDIVTGGPEEKAVCKLSMYAVIILQNCLRRTYLIRASRGEIPRLSSAGEEPQWVGLDGRHVVELLSLIYSLSRPEYLQIMEKIKRWAEKFEVHELHAGWIGASSLKASFRDPILLRARPNLADAGRGSKQILPVIAQIFFSDEGSTIMVEEPEASLHLALLLNLMELFGEATKENKQIIVTTHSPDIPSILKRSIKSRFLKAKDVAIYELDKSKEGSKAKRLRITKRGIVKGFIPSISKAEEKLLEME